MKARAALQTVRDPSANCYSCTYSTQSTWTSVAEVSQAHSACEALWGVHVWFATLFLQVLYITSRAYREKRACNIQTSKFLLLLKVTFMCMRMWNHKKSIKHGPWRPGLWKYRPGTHHHITCNEQRMYSAHQFFTESTHSWQRLGFWWHQWWLQVTGNLELTVTCCMLLTISMGT